MTWHDHAACAGHDDPELWCEQPKVTGDRKLSQWGTGAQREAVRICLSECPVKGACLRAALAEERGVVGGARYTIRGGLTPVQRARVEAERARLGLTA